jgi:hypothetical protein
MLRIDISSFDSSDWFYSEVYFVRYEYNYSCLFVEFIWLENFFPHFDSKPVFIFFQSDDSLVSNIWLVLFFNPTWYSVSFDWVIEAIYIQC